MACIVRAGSANIAGSVSRMHFYILISISLMFLRFKISKDMLKDILNCKIFYRMPKASERPHFRVKTRNYPPNYILAFFIIEWQLIRDGRF